ncbi:MAG TPA: ComEC/Rec2 family competence protein [Intrasporangium sp.]|uniref:ComEC/Rec2 family competence protein n=1 Tax=Intrasporangium sp. TaxID=1925024 RepID=UPI002B4A1015|nr:ComEC/Rec2 family competence protein [Intrasporangium sp.]HKX68600.1 ComEC/Rec2 family competence protein [Intrasporangium sp.]
MSQAPARTLRADGPDEVVRVPRRLDARLLVPVVVAWPVVAFAGLVVPTTWVWWSALASGLGSALMVQRRVRSSGRRLLALTLAVLSLTLLAVAGHRTVRDIGPLAELAEARAVVTVRGVIATEPIVVGGPLVVGGADTAVERQEPTRDPIVVVRLEVRQVAGRGRVTEVNAPILVTGDRSWAERSWQEEVEAVLRLSTADPGDDVVALARPKGEPTVIGRPGLVFRAADSVRADFRDATAGLTPDARGLVPALVIGDTSRTPPDLTEAMLHTGLSHLSAVSGSNVTLVLATALGLCRLLGVPRRGRPWVALCVLAGFVILARPEPSVIRAGVMGVVGLLALSTSRRQAGVPALSGAIVGLLVWDPWLARSYGFALSSVATLGLLLFAQPWGRAIARGLPRSLAWFGPVLAVPLAAQAVCGPIVVPLQGSVSLIAVLANLLAAPLVAPTTIVGVAVAVLSVVWIGGASWLAWLAGAPAQGIAWVARTCAEAPFGSIDWGDSAVAAVLLAVVTAVVIVVWPWVWRHVRLRPLVAAAVVLVATVAATPTSVASWPPPGWVFVACDVGQGDGLVINSGIGAGTGHAVVVDAGGDPGRIDGCLGRLGIRVVDLVVLSHFHADHVAGLAGVLEGRTVAETRVSTVVEPEHMADQVLEVASAGGVPVRELRAGDSFTVGALTAEVWWPARNLSEGSVPNNGSVVMTVHVRGVDLLLSGDIEREAAAQVIRAAQREPERWGEVDVYKVAHHGSSNRDDRLLDLISGQVAIISVGADNDYGHPAPSLLHALESRGFVVHRTDLEGDIAVVVDAGGQLTVRN